MVTSTPNLSREKIPLNDSEVSFVEQPPSPPLLLTDISLNETNLENTSYSSQLPKKKETQDDTALDDELGNTAKTENKRKLNIGKGVEIDNVSKSVPILMKAVQECDCEETNVQSTKSSKVCNKEALIKNKVKKFASNFASKPASSTAHGRSNLNTSGQNSEKSCPLSLAQLTARRRGDGADVDSVDHITQNSEKIKQLNDSDITMNELRHESLEAHSLADSSASGSRVHSLESKLRATMLILKNKEDTVRVQAESLALAEAQIATLTAKAQQTSNKLHQAQQTPLCSSRNRSTGCRVKMTDVSAEADLQDMDHRIVNTLRENLSVIEELYRECFYESVKQEELITMLRRSYLDMRLVERQKTEQIGRLQSVVHSQRCSLERCQDIALEVENLKSEITNFLNSSQNNDSGVWEREECGDVTEDLRGIADQLRHLRDLLNTDCTCGLEEENMKLRGLNDSMELQIGELRQKVNDLEEALENKENIDQKHQIQIQDKEQELQRISAQLAALEECSRDRDVECDALNCKLKQMEVLLMDKSSELLYAQQQCEEQEAIIKELREGLRKAELMAQESGQVHDEVTCLSAQVAQWRDQLTATRRRLRALEAELQRAREHCRHLAEHYREKTQVAEQLQSQLEEAQSRGAELCGEARRAVCGVRHWLRRQRLKNKNQEEIIKNQELLIQSLQGTTKSSERTRTSEEVPTCSKYATRVEARQSDHSFVSARETGCSKCAVNKVDLRTSASEIASSPTPPTPPRRLLRKKAFCEDIRCQCPAFRDSSVQLPTRSNASVEASLSHERLSAYTPTSTREVSPPDELLERVERAHEALADAHRRWTRGAGRAGRARDK